MAGTPADWLARHAALRPTATALLHGDQGLSYAELESSVANLAERLLAEGIAAGEVIAHHPADALPTVLLLHAAHRLNCAFYPLDPRLPHPHVGNLLAEAGVEWQADFPCRSAFQARLVRASSRPAQVAPERRSYKDDAIRLIIATSGSSDRPKGVMLTAQALYAAVRASRERIPLNPGDIWLCCLPLFHIGGIAIPLRCAEAGATTLLHDHFDAASVMADLHAHRVTHISLVPTMLHRLLALNGTPPPSLRVALIGGAGLPPALANRAVRSGWPICVSYGMTECASQVATGCGIDGDWDGSCGKPLPGTELHIQKEGGSIRVSGPTLMAGYANPERRLGLGLLPDGSFRTGDLGRLDESGNLYVLGRADWVAISGGENIPLAQVEQAAASHPQVTEAAVCGLPDAEWGERVALFYLGEVDEATLAGWLRERLPPPWRPKEIRRVEELPRTAGGKVDFKQLPSWSAKREFGKLTPPRQA